MGYDLHITRAETWTDSAAHPIEESEWRACAASDPELEGIADFREGRIVVKNPDDSAIARMLEVAKRLNAHVEGDDGEFYEIAGEAPRPAPPPERSLGERVASWFGGLRPQRETAAVTLPFGVGDRVRDPWGHEGRVMSIDVNAQFGLGEVRVRFDDGAENTFTAVAHGLAPVKRGTT
jgi:hypothetical protein